MGSRDDIVASMIDMLARIEEAIGAFQQQNPAVVSALGAEVVSALDASATRIETALQGLVTHLDEGFARLAARVGETSARIVELSDATSALLRRYTDQLAFLESQRLNAADAVRRLEEEIQTKVLDKKR